MRAPLLFALALVLAAGLLSGCGASNQLGPEQNATSGETAEVTASLGDAPELMENGLFESEEVYALDAIAQSGALGSVLGSESVGDPGPVQLAPIRPLRYWRHITSIRRHFSFEWIEPDPDGVPTLVIVSVKKLLRGSFNILAAKPDATNAADVFKVRKRLADVAKHRFVLKRVRPGDEPTLSAHRDRRWKLVGISGVLVQSVNPTLKTDISVIDIRPTPGPTDPATRIRAIRFQTRDSDITVTDPLELQRLHAVMQFEPEEDVKITVTTLAPDDVVVLMHHHRKLLFENNGDNTYSGKWSAPARQGFRFAGFNALSHGTLFDDEDPYRSSGWILPYIVRGMGPTLAWHD